MLNYVLIFKQHLTAKVDSFKEFNDIVKAIQYLKVQTEDAFVKGKPKYGVLIATQSLRVVCEYWTTGNTYQYNYNTIIYNEDLVQTLLEDLKHSDAWEKKYGNSN